MRNTSQIMRTLLLPVKDEDQSLRNSERIDTLTDLVFMLLAEVEALRSAMQAIDPETYKTSYKEAMILSNNGAGVNPGIGKILERYIGKSANNNPDEDSIHGVELLQRLGCTEKEMANFIKRVEEVREFT